MYSRSDAAPGGAAPAPPIPGNGKEFGSVSMSRNGNARVLRQMSASKGVARLPAEIRAEFGCTARPVPDGATGAGDPPVPPG